MKTFRSIRLLIAALLAALATNLTACSGGDDTTNTSPPQTVAPLPPAPPQLLHQDQFPDLQGGVSFSDVLSLTYSVSASTLAYGDDSLQVAEYWPPRATTRPNLPAIILVHGGCWSNGFRIEQTYPAATALALNGFPVWSLTYRATGDVGGGWPGTSEDVNQGIAAILNTSTDFYSQRAHIVIGHSAGGHLSLLARTVLTVPFEVIGLAAITDITQYANSSASCSGLARSFMDGPPNARPDAYVQATPNFTQLINSTVLYSGTQDSIVPLIQAELTGLPIIALEQAGHFDWIHPGTPSFNRVVTDVLADALQ